MRDQWREKHRPEAERRRGASEWACAAGKLVERNRTLTADRLLGQRTSEREVLALRWSECIDGHDDLRVAARGGDHAGAVGIALVFCHCAQRAQQCRCIGEASNVASQRTKRRATSALFTLIEQNAAQRACTIVRR